MSEIEKGREYSRETNRVIDEGMSKEVKLGSRQRSEWFVRRLDDSEEEEEKYSTGVIILLPIRQWRDEEEIKWDWNEE